MESQGHQQIAESCNVCPLTDSKKARFSKKHFSTGIPPPFALPAEGQTHEEIEVVVHVSCDVSRFWLLSFSSPTCYGGPFASQSLVQTNKQAARCAETAVAGFLFFFPLLTTQETLLIHQLLNHINLRLIKRPHSEWQRLLCHRRTHSLFPINKCYYPGIELLSGELLACFLRCFNTLSASHYRQINCPFTAKGYQSNAVILFSSPSV